MKDTIERVNGFEAILPFEVDLPFNTEEKWEFSKKLNIDYKTPKYKEMCTDFYECVAA